MLTNKKSTVDRNTKILVVVYSWGVAFLTLIRFWFSYHKNIDIIYNSQVSCDCATCHSISHIDESVSWQHVQFINISSRMYHFKDETPNDCMSDRFYLVMQCYHVMAIPTHSKWSYRMTWIFVPTVLVCLVPADVVPR